MFRLVPEYEISLGPMQVLTTTLESQLYDNLLPNVPLVNQIWVPHAVRKRIVISKLLFNSVTHKNTGFLVTFWAKSLLFRESFCGEIYQARLSVSRYQLNPKILIQIPRASGRAINISTH